MATDGATGRVAGKRVLITGAARGMGRSHAVRLAEQGADCILVDICCTPTGLDYPLATEEDLNETVRLVEKHGSRAVPKIVDVRDEAAMKAAVDAAVDELGGSTARSPTRVCSPWAPGTPPPPSSGGWSSTST